MSNTMCSFDPDGADMILACEWLAKQFLAPPDDEQVRSIRSLRGQIALREIGASLNQQQAADTICQIMNADSSETVAETLQRRHVALFEGMFRQRCVLPYASVWDGTDRLGGPAVTRIKRLMRDLDIHLDSTCTEMPDHLGICLAVLAEALRQQREDVAAILLSDMRGWVPRFGEALIRADGTNYYGNLARLLMPLLDRIGEGLCSETGHERNNARDYERAGYEQ
ncbi:MAG: molecular chaperone TorD family protein [Rhodopseudomonas sp.]|uniref:TorD/DmsD family molecular chaperone n=1 Tax=Rhodopseudomonas sp. TaxID=1078 RepID=UPI0039E69802